MQNMKTLFSILFILILFSCSNSVSENIINDSSLKDDFNKKEIIKKESWTNIEDSTNIEIRKKMNKLMKSKNFYYKCIDNCTKAGTSINNLNSHVGKPFYSFNKLLSDSLVYIRYQFIEDCCKEFGGDFELKQDTLQLIHYQINIGYCPCYCKYEYAFTIPIKNIDNYIITLNDVVLK